VTSDEAEKFEYIFKGDRCQVMIYITFEFPQPQWGPLGENGTDGAAIGETAFPECSKNHA